MSKFHRIVDFIKSLFPNQDFIPLHEPRFTGNEKKYVVDAIDSTYVSSVGGYVNRFEEMIASIAGTRYAIATVNGTSALHMALVVAGVRRGDEVISQALSFVATANAINYIGAYPVFIDVDKETMGMSALALDAFLVKHAEKRKEGTFNRSTGRRIASCVPMHTFGFPSEIDKIVDICERWNISLIEDAAESLGSYYMQKHTGSFGQLGIFSFNGNKTVTCGGGGAIVTNDQRLASLAKHLTTQAKLPHKWEFNHDYIGYNYRLPNLNAALACAQLENLKEFVENKRELAALYKLFFDEIGIEFKHEPKNSVSNYWLNAIQFDSRMERDTFLEYSNANGVMTRPVWALMSQLPMYSQCQRDELVNSQFLADRIVNIPSSVRL